MRRRPQENDRITDNTLAVEDNDLLALARSIDPDVAPYKVDIHSGEVTLREEKFLESDVIAEHMRHMRGYGVRGIVVISGHDREETKYVLTDQGVEIHRLEWALIEVMEPPA